MDIEKVPYEFGHLSEYRGVTGTPPPQGGFIGPHGPKVVEEERQQEVARGPLAPIRIGNGKGGGPCRGSKPDSRVGGRYGEARS